LVGGLAVFVVVAAVAGLLAIGQGLARHHGAGAEEQRIEAALGLTRAERVLARLLPALLGAAIAVLLAVGGALVAARAEPLGSIGAFEPDPGWRPDWLVVVLGGLAVGVAFLAAAAATAARVLSAGQHPAGLARPSRIPFLARRSPILAGAGFALSAGGRGRSVPVRATLIGAVVGVAGVVAAGTFASSLGRLEAEPARYGWVADFAWIDARDPQLAEIEQDPAVQAVGFTTEGQVELPRGNVFATALDSRKGDIAYTLLEGRAPRTPREMSVGPRLADRLGVDVGDTVAVRPPSGGPVNVIVTGIVVVPAPGSGRFGETAVFTPDGLTELSNGQPFTAALIRATGSDQAHELFDRYAGDLELVRAAPPEDVQGLLDLNPLPSLLGWFLAAVAAAVLAHALVVTTRRRARDLAVLRVIGFTPRQVAASVVTMATMTAAIGLVVGVPLGLAVGRLVWAEAAAGAAVGGDTRVPLLLLAVLPIAAVLGATLVSLLPARRAALLRPSVVLHSE
jgi:hypothetical protein